jgi:hypothetical protein
MQYNERNEADSEMQDYCDILEWQVDASEEVSIEKEPAQKHQSVQNSLMAANE